VVRPRVMLDEPRAGTETDHGIRRSLAVETRKNPGKNRGFHCG
jgi:hypothetical protein